MMKQAMRSFRRREKKAWASREDFHYAAFRPLFYSGKIFITHRDRGIFRMPCYELFLDHFPKIELESVDEAKTRKFMILKALSAYGVTPSRHVAYWLGYKVKETEEILQELEKEHLVAKIKIEGLRGFSWICVEDLAKLGSKTDEEDSVALLTLMDNLIRDRKWLQQLFNYTFEVEYFQKKGMKWHVNILHNHEFLGFVNPKFERSTKRFIIKDISLKRRLDKDEWCRVLDRTKELAQFHDAETIQVQRTKSREIQKALLNYGFSKQSKGEVLVNLK
jgi:uncharacterized protein YcaQ